MVIAAQRDAKNWEAERRAGGREAFRALDADRQKINETLRQGGIQVDPLAGLAPSFARRTTANKEEGDAIEQAIADARMNPKGGPVIDDATAMRLREKFGAPATPRRARRARSPACPAPTSRRRPSQPPRSARLPRRRRSSNSSVASCECAW